MKDKNELIADILDLYDSLSYFKTRLAEEKSGRKAMTVDEKYDAYMVDEGREAVFATHVLDKVRVEGHFTGEDFVCDSFEQWADKAIFRVPDYFSRDDFKAYFHHLLRDMYEERKAEAWEREAAEIESEE